MGESIHHLRDEMQGLRSEMGATNAGVRSLASDFHSMSRAVVLSVTAMAITLAVLVLTVGVASLNA